VLFGLAGGSISGALIVSRPARNAGGDTVPSDTRVEEVVIIEEMDRVMVGSQPWSTVWEDILLD
jgi:hypothetical protein